MESNTIVQVEAHPQAVLVRAACNEFDMAQTKQLKQEICDAADAHDVLPVVLDLNRVAFMASMTLGTLVELNGLLKKKGQSLILTGIQPQIQQVMEASALHRLFDIRQEVSSLVS